MRILMVGPVPGSFARPDGGVQAAMVNLVNALRGQPEPPTIVLLDPLSGVSRPTVTQQAGIRVYRSPRGLMVGRGERWAAVVREVAQREHVDLIHLQGLALEVPGFPTMLTVHGLSEEESRHEDAFALRGLRSLTWGRGERRRRNRAPNVIAISRFVQGMLPPVRSRRTWLIPNAVAPQTYRMQRDPEPGRLLYVGALRPLKDLRALITALSQAAPGPTLRIVGGPLNSRYGRQCQDLARNTGVPVEFLGPRDAASVREEMARAQYLALPSRWESTPLVIAEAQAMGLPALASSVGAIPEMLQDGSNGYLIGDRTLPETLDLAMSTQHYAQLCEAASRAGAAYHADRVAQATLAAYRQLLQS